LEVPSLREPAGTLLSRCETWMRDAADPGAKQRHVMALSNRLRALEEGRAAGVELTDADKLQQWTHVSRMSACSRGTGSPNPRWMYRPGHAELTVPHERDYLYFNIPLRGDFEIECDVPVTAWSFSSLMVAGRWLGPIYTQSGFDSGVFRWQAPREQFLPPLTRSRHWMHYRAAVRDGSVTTYFNGRRVHSRTVPKTHDPWVAFRSNPRDRGSVRNVRITGAPVIPEVVELSEDIGLSQWYAYFEEPVGDVGDHWCMQNGELTAIQDGAVLHDTSLTRPGSDDSTRSFGWDERVLYYHRPILEEGVIQYEFLYEEGRTHVHPVLDRLAFLIGPSGILLHQITDGAWDRTGLSPANVFDEPENRRGPVVLPLKPGEWNQLALDVRGDVVSVVLNEIEVFRRTLEPGNNRTFGLFHFADQTAVRVRNITWKGNWPRQLPPIADQPLAGPDVEDVLTEFTTLASTFEHDFRTSGFSLDKFAVLRGTVGRELTATPEGLRASRIGTGNYQNATLAPSLTISGDFDVIAEYENFSASSDTTGACTIALLAVLNNSSRDEFFVARRHAPKEASPVDQIVQCAIVQRLPEGERRSYFVTEPMEENSGRLRLARRGETLYYLTAEYDSPNWILRGTHAISTDPVAADGLRLMTQIHQAGGSVSVVWKRLRVHAAGLSGPAVGGISVELAELNAQRDMLPVVLQQDFRRQPPTADQFYTWSVSTERITENGWVVAAAGSDSWTSAGAAAQTAINGDFDITVRFDPRQLALPRPDKHTQVYLQAEGSDPNQTQLNSILSLLPDGEVVATAQVRERGEQGEYYYRPIGHLGMPTVKRLRLARRGSTVAFLAASENDGPDQVIARYEFNALPIPPRSIRFMLHTGGEGRESVVDWQTISVHAENVVGAAGAGATGESATSQPPPGTMQPGQPVRPVPEKGLLESIFDLFR
ncbi:MAG: DUF1583 domain-containing protein, partial [Planctomycetaceae bacterium]|nr:DUF1583 domain-containing protein [Planctomycetaceae bacterium]